MQKAWHLLELSYRLMKLIIDSKLVDIISLSITKAAHIESHLHFDQGWATAHISREHHCQGELAAQA